MSILTIIDPRDAQTPPLSKETSSTSRWLGDSISKKHYIVPITILMEDMVSKFLGKIFKPKKLKTQAMVEVDEAIGHWVAKVAKPISARDLERATRDDFTVEKIDLGVASKVVDAKHLESSTKRMRKTKRS